MPVCMYNRIFPSDISLMICHSFFYLFVLFARTHPYQYIQKEETINTHTHTHTHLHPTRTTGIPNNLMPYVAKVAVGKLSHLTVFGGDDRTNTRHGEYTNTLTHNIHVFTNISFFVCVGVCGRTSTWTYMWNLKHSGHTKTHTHTPCIYVREGDTYVCVRRRLRHCWSKSCHRLTKPMSRCHGLTKPMSRVCMRAQTTTTLLMALACETTSM